MDSAWPLTGRAEELAAIDSIMLGGAAGKGVVLAGAAGVGKTRLAEECMLSARRRGAKVHWVVATESARAVPLGAFAAVLTEAAAPGAGPPALRQVAAGLTRGAPPAGLVVGVDDAHLLDEMSALLLHQLVLGGAADVLLTVRTSQPAPHAVTALWKDRHLHRLDVRPLPLEMMSTLVETALGGQVDGPTTRVLCSLARGSALYLRELIDGGKTAGRLGRRGGVWRWSGEPLVSAGLCELIEHQMGRIPARLEDVVDLLALGEPIGVEQLRDLTAPSAVELAETRGLVKVEAAGDGLQARLAHPLYGEVRRARLGRLRAARLRGRLAQAIPLPGASVGDLLRRAVLILGSDQLPAPELFADAAEHALALCDLALAERLARAAVQTGGGRRPHLTLAYTLTLLGRGEDAEREFQRTQPVPPVEPSPVEPSPVEPSPVEPSPVEPSPVEPALFQAGNLFWVLGRPDAAEAALEGELASTAEAGARSALIALRSAMRADRGAAHAAIDDARQALSSRGLPAFYAVFAARGLVTGLGEVGRADQVDAAAARGYAAAEHSSAASFHRHHLGADQIGALQLAGYLDAADRIAAERRSELSAVPGSAAVIAVALDGKAALGHGRLAVAQRCFREALAALADCGLPCWEFESRLGLTLVLAKSGRGAEAQQALSDLRATSHAAFKASSIPFLLAEAWVAAAQGALSEAIRRADDASRRAAVTGRSALEMYALHTAVCLGGKGFSGRLARLADVLDGPRAAIAFGHAAALDSGDGDALLACSRRWAAMGDALVAADTAAQAASVYQQVGRKVSARGAAARARLLAEDCQGAWTPALVAAGRPLPITVREREVLSLAVEGLSNRRIAERLVVSVRTVEGHLYRAGEKLGARNRGEFRALFQGD